ncbi:MAG: ATP synthase F1 subunit epsilon [Patescibacteria group bacterium]|nr:ATP synthase F1 subunit epsilon [Patescibacteria group bacterium]
MADKKTIKFEIVTPERTVLSKEIMQVTVPTQDGEITILPEHIPLVSILKPGVLEIKSLDQSMDIISVSGGFIEVLRDKVVVLADTAERGEELDEERVATAKAKAEKAKAEAINREDYDLSAVAVRLEVVLARERALHKWRKLKNIK